MRFYIWNFLESFFKLLFSLTVERCVYEAVSPNECPTNAANISVCSLNMADGDLCKAPARWTLPDGTKYDFHEIDNCKLNFGVFRCNRHSSGTGVWIWYFYNKMKVKNL